MSDGIPAELKASDGYRLCTTCKSLKPYNEYYMWHRKKKSHISGGPRGSCKSCICKAKSEERRRLRNDIIHHYSQGSMKCACCSESRLEVLDLDHINGGGNRERKHMSLEQRNRLIIRKGYPPGYRILCRNCNWLAYLRLKEREDKENGDV